MQKLSTVLFWNVWLLTFHSVFRKVLVVIDTPRNTKLCWKKSQLMLIFMVICVFLNNVFAETQHLLSGIYVRHLRNRTNLGYGSVLLLGEVRIGRIYTLGPNLSPLRKSIWATIKRTKKSGSWILDFSTLIFWAEMSSARSVSRSCQ